MTDSLTVFGTDYTGVTGIKAHNTSDSSLLAYIRPEGTKNISANGTGIDVAQYASVDVAVPSGSPNLQSKSKSYTPTESAQFETVSADTGYDGLSSVDISVGAISGSYVGSGITRCDSSDLTASGATVTAPAGYYASSASKAVVDANLGIANVARSKSGGYLTTTFSWPNFTAGYLASAPTAAASQTIQTETVTPTTSTQIVTPTGSNNYLDSVTVNPIPSQYIVPTGTYTVSGSGTADVTNYASASVAAGSATASATKGSVSNHSITVTPSVTRTAGWVTAGSANGTAVTVSASELVSGSETKTENGTYDVTNLAELVVDVSGGGTSSVQVGTKTTTLSAEASSISFTGLSGNPSSFVITSQSDVATNTDGVTAVVYDGTSLHGQTMTTQVEADTGFTKSYSSGTLTITATTAQFQANAYKLAYTYSGSSSDIHTSDVQVGSGATSITFSSLSGRPMYWSCIFKSSFSTSSGYQRVIAVANDGSSIYGLDMDSSAHAATAWTATYSGGNLTISSGGTNNGGYFHQPGYYQLTYAVDGSAPEYQVKTVTPTTSTQNVYPDSGYDALEEVIVNAIPSQYIVPTGNIAITSNTTGSNTLDVSQYATATVNVPTSGSSMNVQTAQSTTRSTSTSGTSVISLTCSKAGTYTVRWSTFRSSTSGTWGSRLYIGGTAYETMHTGDWSNHIQNREVTGVSISANQAVAVYVQSRGSSYYGYVGTLTIIQTA